MRSQGERVGIIDLADYPMPMYHGDLEARDGVPASAGALAERLGNAEVLVIVSPEYNGAFPPLLKNTVDWTTRIDPKVLAHLDVLLASATPGSGGGSRGLAMIELWMANIGVAVAETSMSVGAAALTDAGSLSGIDPEALAVFTAQARRPEAVASGDDQSRPPTRLETARGRSEIAHSSCSTKAPWTNEARCPATRNESGVL